MIEARYAATDWIKARTSISLRRRLARSRVEARVWNAGFRGLPDFLIIGAQRGGTSSLYTYLGRHPRIVPSLRKEVEYLSTRFGEGEKWYRAHFPLSARLAASRLIRGGRTLTFEATPDYLLDPRAPQRAARLLPDARILVLLRNPVDRAYSQYLHNRRLGHEPLTFAEALDQEGPRTNGEMVRTNSNPDYPAIALRRYGYVARGLYADQLERWFAQYPRERVLLLQTEEFFADPVSQFGQILQFLGLPDWQPGRFDNYSSVNPRDKMTRDVRERLAEKFREPNSRLYDLIGRDLGWKP